jgi:WD40 repeat protein
MLSASPSAEFEDHEYPIHSVSLDTEGSLAAAGAEDGSVIVWDLRTHTALFQYQASAAKRPVTAMKWLPAPSLSLSPSDKQLLILSTADGKLLCIDTAGQVVAQSQLDIALLSLDTDGEIVVGGGVDGSVRCWQLEREKERETRRLKEVAKVLKAHSGAVTAVCLALPEHSEGGSAHTHGHTQSQGRGRVSEMLVTGSDDCSIRVWRMGYDR